MSTQRIDSEEVLRYIVRQLIALSVWFEVLPLPDDEWDITVKVENRQRLTDIADKY